MCKYAQSTSPLYLSFLDRAIHMAAHEEAGLPSPSGEAHEHFFSPHPPVLWGRDATATAEFPWGVHAFVWTPRAEVRLIGLNRRAFT